MAVLAASLCASAAAQAPARVALLLAAENYTHFKSSPVGVARAEAMAAALRDHGFAVTLAADPDSTATRSAIQTFARDARDAHLALVILSGHGAASLGRTFFLPVDAQLSRATDLLSRGVTIDSVAQSAAGAQRGAVLFLMSAANFAATLGRVDAQASMATAPAEHVTVVFSSSDRVPVTSMDSVAARAADGIVQALGVSQPGLSALLDAAAGTGGLLLGSRAEAELWRSPEPVLMAEQPVPPAGPDAAVEAAVDATAETPAAAPPQRTDEALARAETSPPAATDGASANTEQQGAAAADVIASASPADTAGAVTQAPAQEASAAALAQEGASTEVTAREAGATAPAQEGSPSEAPSAAAQAAMTQPPTAATGGDGSIALAQDTPATAPPAETVATPATETMDLAALQAAEARLSAEERRQIQRALRARGLYRGSIDAIFGPLTRAAIRQLQREAQAAETGYLTPEQARLLNQP